MQYGHLVLWYVPPSGVNHIPIYPSFSGKDHVKIHSVDLGASAPHLSNARVRRQEKPDPVLVSIITDVKL